MQPIDQPFRPKWDFYAVWALLGMGTLWLTRGWERDEGWIAYPATVIIVSLFSTIILYGPVLLARQIIRSGSRGWSVARMLLAILLVGVLLFGGLYFSGFYTERRARILAFLLAMTATMFLSWRTERK